MGLALEITENERRLVLFRQSAYFLVQNAAQLVPGNVIGLFRVGHINQFPFSGCAQWPIWPGLWRRRGVQRRGARCQPTPVCGLTLPGGPGPERLPGAHPPQRGNPRASGDRHRAPSARADVPARECSLVTLGQELIQQCTIGQLPRIPGLRRFGADTETRHRASLVPFGSPQKEIKPSLL